MATLGHITPESLVSPDRQRWATASLVKGLVFQVHCSDISPVLSELVMNTPPDSDAINLQDDLTNEPRRRTNRAPREVDISDNLGEEAIGGPTDAILGRSAKPSGYIRPDEVGATANQAFGNARDVSTRVRERAVDSGHRTTRAAMTSSDLVRRRRLLIGFVVIPCVAILIAHILVVRIENSTFSTSALDARNEGVDFGVALLPKAKVVPEKKGKAPQDPVFNNKPTAHDRMALG